MKLGPLDFNRVIGVPVRLGIGSKEKEEFLAHVLSRHSKENQPFETPLQYYHDHSNMVPKWLNDHGNYQYTLTEASLGLLFEAYGK